MKIVPIEIDTQYGKFRSVIELPDDDMSTEEEIEAMKQEKLNRWLEAYSKIINFKTEEDMFHKWIDSLTEDNPLKIKHKNRELYELKNYMQLKNEPFDPENFSKVLWASEEYKNWKKIWDDLSSRDGSPPPSVLLSKSGV